MKTSRVFQFAAALALGSVLALVAGTRSARALPPPPFSDISAGLTAVDDSSVAWGDYDSDGDLDILLTGNKGNGTTQLWENNNGSFSEDTAADVHLREDANSVYYGSAAWGDYDSDGDLDILVTGMSNDSFTPIAKIFKNDGGVFSEDTTADAALSGVWYSSVAWGDYNADGKPDILLTGNSAFSGTALVSKIYKNNGNGIFSEVPDTNLVPVDYSSVAWGDYNSDGYSDILLTGQGYNPGPPASYPKILKIYKNNGNGVFSEDTAAESGLPPVSGSSVAWGDYDSDGHPDILLTGAASTTEVSRIYRNNGNGTFTEDTTADSALTGVQYGSSALGDYSADGKLDILLAGSTGSTQISKLYLNKSDGSFSEDTIADTALTGVDWSSVAWGDFGNVGNGTPDGRLDILLTGHGSTFFSAVYERSTAIVETNDSPSAPSSLSASFASGIETLSWNAATDSEQTGTPNGLTYNVRVGTTSGASNVVSPLALANGARLVPQFGNAGERTSYKLSGLTPGTTYHWSVQAVDNGFAGSAFASEGTFTVPESFAFSSAAYSVGEAGNQATITINRSGWTAGAASVHFATANGSATAGSDYTAVSQTVSFAGGETSKSVSIPINDDNSVESSETVLLSLSSPSSGATLGSPSAAVLTITDNDVAPPPVVKPSGKIKSAKLSKTSFTAAQAKTVKLTCKFSPKSKVFRYVLSLKKGKKWTVVKRVSKTGFYKAKYTLAVKKLFAGKRIKSGQYRLKLSADRNSKTLSFKIK